MKQLNNVTLIAVCGNKHGETIASLYKSLQQINPAKTLLLTNIDISASGIECINVGGLNTWQEYNRFVVKELSKYISTEFVLITQHDSWVLNGDCWDDDFLNYDVVGAKWLDIGKPFNTSNGGFTLRSKKLHDILCDDENIITTCPEDVAICKVYGQYLIDKYGIKFCTEEVADKFSFELNEPLQKTFGFHSWHWQPFRETVVFKRSHALGDVLQIEPVMHHYHKKGFQVALDTSDYFQEFFIQHYFPVVPKKHLNPNLPYTEIDLNLSYEVKPDQLHLETYYEFAQVPKEEMVIRNPKLSLSFDPQFEQNKLFPKYCILHLDERNEYHRNVYGIDWDKIVAYLNEIGYVVIQIGVGNHKKIKGAIEMKTPTAPFLMWVVGSSDLFVGIDSGVSHVASGFDIPSVIFFGSVNPEYIHPDLSNKEIITNHSKENPICNTPYCWGSVKGGTSGQPCYVDEKKPPCVQFKNEQVISAINKLINKCN